MRVYACVRMYTHPWEETVSHMAIKTLVYFLKDCVLFCY